MKKKVALAGFIVSVVLILILGFENILYTIQVYILFWDFSQPVTVIVFLAAVLGFVAGLFWNMYRSSSDEYADEEDSDDSVDEPSENSDAETQASPSEASEPEVSAATPDSDDEDDVLTPGEEEARKDSFDS